MSNAAPSRVIEPRERATRPSTRSRASATALVATTTQRGTVVLRDCTTSTVTATTRAARTRVTVLAGPSSASPSRRMPRSSSSHRATVRTGPEARAGTPSPTDAASEGEEGGDARQYGQGTAVNRAHRASVSPVTSHTMTDRRRFTTSRTWREPTCLERPARTG